LLTVDLGLLQDINAIPEMSGSLPGDIVDVNGVAFFAASTLTMGQELWKSDGTEGGTVRVKDIRAGSGSSLEFGVFTRPTNVGGTLYFSANDGSSGFELWKSDGTEAGTVLVEDLTGDSGGADPREITLVGGRLYVAATDDLFGRELWSGVLGSLLGDFDRNGLLEAADIDALVAAIAGAANPLQFDLNNDALVNSQDLKGWLQLGGAANLPSGNPYRPGDANLDGAVDGSDFGIWNANKFTSVAVWSRGDFNADGAVDGSDFGTWNTNKFTASAGVVGSNSSLEPIRRPPRHDKLGVFPHTEFELLAKPRRGSLADWE
jgi:ELWxxDGT repeat protein